MSQALVAVVRLIFMFLLFFHSNGNPIFVLAYDFSDCSAHGTSCLSEVKLVAADAQKKNFTVSNGRGCLGG